MISNENWINRIKQPFVMNAAAPGGAPPRRIQFPGWEHEREIFVLFT